MNDLMQIAQLMKGRNPQEVVMQMIQNNNITDPNISQLVKLAQGGNDKELFNLASQMFQQKGLNLNNELSTFLSLLK